ncbi:MAG: bifunctional UDP-N-acetylglucosamine pyrophosphorylase / glucosamine-phosphate N-acetyltransferase [Frankiales bacterium]|nr:bifunctional UDP-N-acetylglucosamine pyrophosphorylase / glucosamine-phosphate N-acetyltransferase [Frankiales bacterium]
MTYPRPAAVIVLAAGEGTRMKSRSTPKVMHELAGRTLVEHVVLAARGLDPEHLVVVVGHGREQVAPHVEGLGATTVVQEPQNGTGHAVRLALAALPGTLTGAVVVLLGDAPLIRSKSLTTLLEIHAASGAASTLLTAVVPDPAGYGRVVRDGTGKVEGIVEHKDASQTQLDITEMSTGIYAFDAAKLADALGKITTDNAQGEEYLTDVVGIHATAGETVDAVVLKDHREALGVNDRVQLSQLARMLNDRLLEGHMRNGVTILDPATTWVHATVTADPDAVIHPNTQLRGVTHLGEGAEVGPSTTLTDTAVGAGAVIRNSVCEGADVGEQATVGPFAYLRPGSKLGRKAKVGGFVEIKASTIGDGSKVPHLSYVGDAVIGEGSNIGAATVVVNYDGQDKHRTEIGDHVRIGSDTMLVAPVTIGDGAYTAAGSVITEDVPPGAIGVGRARQRNIDGWVQRKRPGTPAAEAAEKAHNTKPQGDGT